MKTLSTQRFRSGLKVCLGLRFLVNITFQYNKGTLRFTKEFTTILDPVLDGNGLLILGQEQDTFGGGFDKFQSFSGKISQFNDVNIGNNLLVKGITNIAKSLSVPKIY